MYQSIIPHNFHRKQHKPSINSLTITSRKPVLTIFFDKMPYGK